jgi:lipopolysaccharide/colanic/teichoic acid biosynthesis glycosyltransferase
MRSRTYERVERAVDVSVALLALVVLLPAIAVVAGLVFLLLGRPILFRQQRAGRYGRAFTILKFRTMRDPDPTRGLITDADRLTPFGRLLRSTSLDELPALYNVIRGDMSLVGPRPLHLRYLSLYSPEQARRHDVRPGITGLAQVRGRNSLSWEGKFALDLEYVANRSAWLDLRILAETVAVVFRRDGISAHGQETVEEFAGSPTTPADKRRADERTVDA